MKTILLKVSGPMQAWGTNSHFNTRHTDLYPSKSAIIGMVSAGIGYRRDETDKILKFNNLKFAVRVDQAGILFKDYHIARKYKSNGEFETTYVTDRYYLQDAVFVVALSGDDETIYTIEKGLKNPYFQLYMGRRSLPVLADIILEVNDRSIIENFEKLSWQASEWYIKLNKNIEKLYIYGDHECFDGYISKFRKDEILSFSQKERKFLYRNEVESFIKINDTTEHDIFKAIE